VSEPGGPEDARIAAMQRARRPCLYRVKVEPCGSGERDDGRRQLMLHVYRDGVESEALGFELTAAGARALLDEVRWLEWKNA